MQKIKRLRWPTIGGFTPTAFFDRNEIFIGLQRVRKKEIYKSQHS